MAHDVLMTTTTNHTSPSFSPRQLVMQTITSPCLETQPAQALIDDCAGDTTLADAGWRYAEYYNTGCRILVRLTGETRYLATWSTWMALVEVADIHTGVRDVDGAATIVTELGAIRGGRKWMTRQDLLV